MPRARPHPPNPPTEPDLGRRPLPPPPTAARAGPGKATRRSPSTVAWSAGGLVLGALLALLVFAPARWLAETVAQLTQDRVLLADARGTLWSGSALAVLSGGAGSRDAVALPGRIHWTLRPRLHSVTTAGADLTLRADCCTETPLQLRLQIGFGQGQATLADARSRWPAAWLAGLGAPWNTLQPEGLLQLSTQGLALHWADGRVSLSGRAELLAQSLASRLSTLRPLGSYRLTVTGGPVPALAVDTVQGSLQLSGSGQWVGGRLRFDGLAQAAADREAALSNLLNIIGQRRGAQSRISLG